VNTNRIHPSKKIILQQTSFQTPHGIISYSLKRSRQRRTITICVTEKARVQVAAPYYALQKDIVSFLQEKSSWVFRKLAEVRQANFSLAQRQFEHGHHFLFLGKKYPIEVIEKNMQQPQLSFKGNRWKIIVPDNLSFQNRQALIKEELIRWYRVQAEEILGGRIFHFARMMGVAPKKIAIRTQKRKWGSCNYRTQTINLNWQIIMSAPEVIDYIVVHELCHLLIPNHSRRFWKKVEGVLPDYAQRKKWLKDNALDMTLP